MTAPNTPNGAFTSADDMLRSIHSLTVAVAENNVQLHALINEMKDVKKDIDMQKGQLDEVKAKLYTMSGLIGVAVSVATTWITGQTNS